MMRRAFGRGLGSRLRSRWLFAIVGLTLLALVVTACGATQPTLATQTAARATQIFPTASPTAYATAPGGNTTPGAAAGTAAGSAVMGSAAVSTASAAVGSATAGMATPTATVRR